MIAKTTVRLTLFCSCAFFLFACQKEFSREPATENNNTGDHLKSYTEAIVSDYYGNVTNTYNLEYDNKGRVTGLVSAASPGDKFTYAYPSAAKYTMDLYNAGALSIHEDFYLNGSSLLDSTFQYNDTKDTMTEKYFYNSNGQLIVLNEYDYSAASGSTLSNVTRYTYDATGNMVKSEDNHSGVQHFEYDLGTTYLPPVVSGPVLSTKKINPIKRITTDSGESVDITYTFDDKKRLVTEKAVASDGSSVTKTYTYY